MSTQAASERSMQNRSMQEAPTRPMMQDGYREAPPSRGTETKPSFLTTEFYIYLAAVGGTLLASYLVGTDSTGVDVFRADRAWWFIAVLTVGYLVSRGLAKAGNSWRHGKEMSARR